MTMGKNRNAGGGRAWARLRFIYRILSTAPHKRTWGKVAVCISLYIFTHKLNQKTGWGCLGVCLWVRAITADAIWVLYIRRQSTCTYARFIQTTQCFSVFQRRLPLRRAHPRTHAVRVSVVLMHPEFSVTADPAALLQMGAPEKKKINENKELRVGWE